eukprot:10381141-Lingulodinium_polyedra.AAC.1
MVSARNTGRSTRSAWNAKSTMSTRSTRSAGGAGSARSARTTRSAGGATSARIPGGAGRVASASAAWGHEHHREHAH